MALVLINAAEIACVCRQGETVKRGPSMQDAAVIAKGSLVLEGGKIAWVGLTRDLPPVPSGSRIIDVSGKTIIPGFVDSHTHLVFSGSRENEFDQRIGGASYQEIAAGGGGINATVKSVRHASKDELKAETRRRLGRFLEFGVTTVEIKSGYGLSLADELKCLQVIAELNAEGPLDLVPTFLGAHAVPPEFKEDREGYVDLLLDRMLPEIAQCGLAEFCDVFCDTGAFTLRESERILRNARDLGLGLKVHADELSSFGATQLAAELGAVSADHLLCVDDEGINALARSGTIATLLPGTAFYLGLNYAPARQLIERGVPVSVASDCNPGTCPSENLPLVGAMACTQMKMLPTEALCALTINAAAALGRSDRIGSIEPGKQADLAICAVPNYRHLFYHFGVNHVWRVIKRGQVVYAA
jgi:imidazolonepropionase